MYSLVRLTLYCQGSQYSKCCLCVTHETILWILQMVHLILLASGWATQKSIYPNTWTNKHDTPHNTDCWWTDTTIMILIDQKGSLLSSQSTHTYSSYYSHHLLFILICKHSRNVSDSNWCHSIICCLVQSIEFVCYSLFLCLAQIYSFCWKKTVLNQLN